MIFISLMLRLLLLRFSSGLDGSRQADSLENCVADSASTGAIQPQKYFDGANRFFQYNTEFLKESRLAKSRKMWPEMLSR